MSVYETLAAPVGRTWGWRDYGSHGELGHVNDGGRFETVWKLDDPLNALCWSNKLDVAYGISASSSSVYLFERDRPAVRRVLTMPRGSGILSGIAIDDEDGIWVTLRDGWSAIRFLPDGTLDRIVSLPVAAPTGIAFIPKLEGTPFDSASLHMTTNRVAQSIESLQSAPLSGHLLRLALSKTDS